MSARLTLVEMGSNSRLNHLSRTLYIYVEDLGIIPHHFLYKGSATKGTRQVSCVLGLLL